ncbi:MAG: NAD(P)-dependent oxidoreductase [Desertimonas sp.]
MSRVTFIGLGVMGGPMAAHLVGAGHAVTVFNRTGSKAEAFVGRHHASRGSTPAAAADGAELVFVCVGNDDDVRAVTTGSDGVLAAMGPGAVLVDHTTTSAVLAREIGDAAAAGGVGFVDAPVSGGQAGAETGRLTVMCGCDDEAIFERARAVIGAYSQRCERLGGVGAGQLTKMVNQICIAGLVQALSEAIAFAGNAGLDVAAVVDVISKGAAQSWQMDNRAETMAAGEFDFGFAVEWMRKDLGFCLDEAARNGSRLPVTALVDQLYAQVERRGGRRWDTSSLIDLLQRP